MNNNFRLCCYISLSVEEEKRDSAHRSNNKNMKFGERAHQSSAKQVKKVEKKAGKNES